jgi:hypothetical protein
MSEINKKAFLYQKIAKVMSNVSRVPKNGYNSFHKYHYATESDLTESIRPMILEAGLVFFSNVLEQERNGEFTKAKMEFTLADIETGESITSTYWGEGQDKGDKGLYKAFTGATKYFLMKTFLIPTGDDSEQDDHLREPKNKQSTNKGAVNSPSEATLKAKYQLLTGSVDGFSDYINKLRNEKKYTDVKIEQILTQAIQKKPKQGA